MDPATLDKLKTAFGRDPLTSFFSLLVAGNRVHPTQIVTIKGRDVMVPKWGPEGWAWWGQLAHVIQDAAYAGATPKSAVALSSKLDDYLLNRPDSVSGDDPWNPTGEKVLIDVKPSKAMPGNQWIGGTMRSAGEMVADAARFMSRNKGVIAAVTAAALAFIFAGPPVVIAAILAWLVANPVELGKVFRAAGELAAFVVGGVVRGLLGFPPIVLVAGAVAAYFMFRGKSAAD